VEKESSNIFFNTINEAFVMSEVREIAGILERSVQLSLGLGEVEQEAREDSN